MTDPAAWEREAGKLFRDAREPRKLQQAVVTFHKRVDEMVEASLAGHAVKIDCARGCSFCCYMPVYATPAEAFALAEWLSANFAPARLGAVVDRLRANAKRTSELGAEGRKHSNLGCALLGDDGACTAYEARPAQCRRFHSMRLATCQASFANPADDAIEAPMHPAVAHNVAVVMAIAQKAARASDLDADPVDMNVALLAAFEGPKSWRRWRDGKKPFVG
jgi:hypothetical protein